MKKTLTTTILPADLKEEDDNEMEDVDFEEAVDDDVAEAITETEEAEAKTEAKKSEVPQAKKTMELVSEGLSAAAASDEDVFSYWDSK